MELRISGAYRWSNCSAAPLFSTFTPPKPDTDSSREGTAAAWVAEQAIKYGNGDCSLMIGRTHENGWYVNETMANDVQGYVTMLLERGPVRAEVHVVLSTNPLIEGTLDAMSAIVIGNTLYVDDLKYGYKLVEVFECVQLIGYARALMNDPLNLAFVHNIQVGIYQPRSFHVDGIYRTWKMSIEELMQRGNFLIEQGVKCTLPNPVATPGKWCDHCPAGGSCQALAASCYDAFEVVRSQGRRDMTGVEISQELDFLNTADELISARKKAMSSEAVMRKDRGEFIPNYVMERRKGKKVFSKDTPAALLKVLTGVDITDTKLCTPKQAEKRGLNMEKYGHYVNQPTLPPTLKRSDSKRAEEIFGVVK